MSLSWNVAIMKFLAKAGTTNEGLMTLSSMAAVVIFAILGSLCGSGFAWLLAGEYRKPVNPLIGGIVSMVSTGVLLWCMTETVGPLNQHAATLAVLLALPVGYWMTER